MLDQVGGESDWRQAGALAYHLLCKGMSSRSAVFALLLAGLGSSPSHWTPSAPAVDWGRRSAMRPTVAFLASMVVVCVVSGSVAIMCLFASRMSRRRQLGLFASSAGVSCVFAALALTTSREAGIVFIAEAPAHWLGLALGGVGLAAAFAGLLLVENSQRPS